MEQISSLEDLLATWPANEPRSRQALSELMDHARDRAGSSLTVIERPNVSYSLRFSAQRAIRPDRPLFFLVDVILSATEPRFLSACFYDDEISDPEELGNAVPQGLFDETGYCFDVEDDQPGLLEYLRNRIDEAFRRSNEAAQ